jgi:glycosyltransferase involved in cell wall biosynthesis
MPSEAPALAVSVAMATWNGAAYVREQLESIAAQTLLPGELLVGDERSTDGTIEIVEQFAADAPFPVRITRNARRLGATENFLAICSRASGPVIALSDQDDVWHADKLERAVRWFVDPEVGLVVHRSLVVDERLDPVGGRYPAFSRTRVQSARRVDPWLAVPGMAMVFRKSLLDAVSGLAVERPREAGGHHMDHDDWIYMLSGSLARTVLLADDLALYRQHGASYMGARAVAVNEQIARGRALGANAFRAQAAMFRARSAFWSALASDPAASPSVREQASRSAAWCDSIAGSQASRAGIHEPSAGRLRRMGRQARLALAGGYRPRTRGGLGLRAFAGDVLGLIAVAQEHPAGTVPADVAVRVDAARAAGQAPDAIAEELTRDGVVSLYGDRWTAEMVRDVAFDARRSAESKDVAAQAAAEADEGVPGSGRTV